MSGGSRAAIAVLVAAVFAAVGVALCWTVGDAATDPRPEVSGPVASLSSP
ncbi:hypothetical protein [Umezawaea sp. NPDC059074]